MIEDLGSEEGLEEYKTSSKIALIDADTIIYASCVVKEYADDLLDWSMYTETEMLEIQDTPGYDEEEHCIWRYNEEEVLEDCMMRIAEIQGLTNTKSVELHFTEGRNFRYEVYDMYKANRKGTRYPQGMSVIKRRLLENYAGAIHQQHEADDAVVMLKRTQPNKYVLCAVDKDVYKAVPGMHFNYYRSAKHGIDMKWVETEAKDAYQFPYLQTLMGDSTDNIPGCPGIGPKKAATALEGLVTPCDMWKAVVKLFKAKNLTVKDAIRDMRLVNMHQLVEIDGKYKVELWNPPCSVS